MLTFSDGTSLFLQNGRDGLDGKDGADGSDGKDGQNGVTPIVKIDEDGYWCVSYDGGVTFEQIVDSDGNPISALGRDGHDGADGKDGSDGKDGANGKDGVDGSDGKDGADGKDGTDGKDGNNGADGKDGTDGKDGANGSDGKDGADGKDGTDGKDGNNGADGRDGICVRVVVNADGYYAFELYSPDAPDVVIETITTPYTSNPASILQSVVQDENTGVITLTMADGSVFKFNLDVTYPTGVVVLTDKIVLEPNGQNVFEFRINPSNARFTPVLGGSDANLHLDVVGTRTSAAASYVTAPEDYKLANVVRSVNADGEIKVGQYCATIQYAGVAKPRSENVVLVLTTRDGRGEQIQLSSSLIEVCLEPVPDPELLSLSIDGIEAVKTDDSVFHIKLPYGTNVSALHPEFVTNGASVTLKGGGDVETVDLSNPAEFVLVSATGVEREYKVVVHYSELPIVYISTPSPITSKDYWTDACTIEIWNADAENSVYKDVQIKGRGNSTWGLAKKPYAIKLDKKAEVLGMPKHKRWVLLANHYDASGLRNEISFYMGRIGNLDYTPRTRFVEFVMNGAYQGLYQVTEQLKVDENRVNVGDDGYLMEIDARAGQDPEDIYFRVGHLPNPVVVKDPDVVAGDEAYNYLVQYLTDADNALYGSDFLDETNGYRKYFDVDSFVDWYLVNEITKNNDAIFFSSCYMNLAKGGKLKMGPLWDFDLAIGNYVLEASRSTNDPQGFYIKDAAWFWRFFKDPYFVACVKDRFNYYYNNRQAIYAELRLQKGIVDNAMAGNEWRWSKFGASDNDDLYVLYDAEIDKMVTWLESRFEWMKKEFDAM